MKRTLLASACTAALAVSAASHAQIVFQGPGSAWNNEEHWVGGEVPGAGDYALIPENLTCIISNEAAEALGVIVEDDAVLGVEGGQSLTLYGVVEDEEDAIEIEPDGLLYVKESGITRSSIVFQAPDNFEEYEFRVFGGGTLSADVDAGYGEARLITRWATSPASTCSAGRPSPAALNSSGSASTTAVRSK
jgi:hypothetical protein